MERDTPSNQVSHELIATSGDLSAETKHWGIATPNGRLVEGFVAGLLCAP